MIIKPFLKWAGSKTKIIDVILHYTEVRDVFIEPFVGSGVVFLNMNGFKKYKVYDINNDLINLYKTLQSEGERFIDYCETFFVPSNNVKDVYYSLREKFNSLDTNNRERAALFVYLNRHCFNGLCRYNARGDFNVPMGKYESPYFPRQEMFTFFERSKNVEFINADFRKAFAYSESEKSCLIYCDPPYVSEDENKNEGFTNYSSNSFSTLDQIDLSNLAKKSKHLCILSNHSTEFTRDIYAGSKIIEFEVKRFIAAKNSDRRNAKELLAVFNGVQ